MVTSFFKLAAVSPHRQTTFRQLVVAHLVLLTAGAAVALSIQEEKTPLLGHVVLIAGIIEGALLLGWRLTQLPKNKSLEFLLVSPLRPRQLFMAETLVGLWQLALVTLSGLPIFVLLMLDGVLWPTDLVALLVMPCTWGAVTGLSLVAWAYETRGVRRWGERVVMGLILVYLTVGVLAAERLTVWLADLPKDLGDTLLHGVRLMHAYSPFTVLRDVLRDPPSAVITRFLVMEGIGLGIIVITLSRAAFRLQGHFQDRHYLPIEDVSGQKRSEPGDQPLAWWAVKRVTEYSGRVNLWLAGGFALIYGAYTVAGPAWPSWLGTQVFVIFDRMGGVPAIAAALVVLAAVPAAFQYGLWDSSVQDRCRRLELLLLTELHAGDYWRAAAAAAWRRGRGYFAVALFLWGCLWFAGKADLRQVLGAAASGVILWGLYFALGFRGFARGSHANNLGLGLSLGLPLMVCVLVQFGLGEFAALLPPGGVYATVAFSPARDGWIVGAIISACLALGVGALTRRQCVDSLRRWYDAHHGQKGLA